MSDGPTDLQLASDDALIKELFSRHHSCALGLWRLHSKSSEKGAFKIRWRGDAFVAAGLAAVVQDEIVCSIADMADDVGADD